jgi:hypothetical protein
VTQAAGREGSVEHRKEGGEGERYRKQEKGCVGKRSMMTWGVLKGGGTDGLGMEGAANAHGAEEEGAG